MKHKKNGRKFGRVRNQRKALFRTLLGSLIMEERITTTEAKAKEAKSKIDRLINKAKVANEDDGKKVAIKRALRNEIPLQAVSKLSGDYIKRFNERNSGYTRVIKLAPRKSDSAKMAIIEFV